MVAFKHSGPLRVIFMGTPQFAVPSLERLIADGHQVVGVYTQPDRPAGRSDTPVFGPVKRAALRHGAPLFQPRSLRIAEEQEQLRALAPDMIVLAAYGLILPQPVLEAPRYGGLNVHPSLLPHHRGPSPIVGALLSGDRETGVTIMLMDAGMDTGPLLAQRTLAIAAEDTAGSLTRKLAHLGEELLSESIPSWARGELKPQPQDHALATYTSLLKKEDGIIDWSRPAEVIARQVRAYQPWPGSATFWEGRRLMIVEAAALAAASVEAGLPGEVVAAPEGAAVRTGDGRLALTTVQREGRKPLPIQEFLKGAQGFVGRRLGVT